jgi:hypothetical protein
MKYQIINKLFVLIISFGCLYYACDAPRHNPLDPENPDNNLASLSGQIETLSHLPVSTANVYWQNDNRYLKTDDQGYFQIKNIPPQDGWIHFSKIGFWDDSIYIEWGNELVRELNISFNAKPRLDSLLIYSIITNIQSRPQILQIGVETIINDPDNDIDTVYVENPDLNFNNYLKFDYTKQMHLRVFDKNQLGISNPDDIIGHEFRIIVKDKFDHWVNLDKMSIKRIIKEQITYDRSPSDFETVPSTPTLTWRALSPGYSLIYNIEVYIGKDEDNIIWQKQGAFQSINSIEVDDLPTGQSYSWAIWYTDEFHNRSRSWIYNFTVE